MVAARMHRQSNNHTNANNAVNVVRRTARKDLVDARDHPRTRVALTAWLCAETGSKRGYALDLSSTGARFGGMGLSLQPGERVIAKIVLDAAEAPLVLRAEVVRYAPAASCPEVCVRFLDGAGAASVDEGFRLARFVDGLRP